MIATKREPSPPVLPQNASAKQFGSIVEPDLDAIAKSEPSTGTARTASGSVESSTCRRSQPCSSPITSGARLEPPIPHSTTRS